MELKKQPVPWGGMMVNVGSCRGPTRTELPDQPSGRLVLTKANPDEDHEEKLFEMATTADAVLTERILQSNPNPRRKRINLTDIQDSPIRSKLYIIPRPNNNIMVTQARDV